MGEREREREIEREREREREERERGREREREERDAGGDMGRNTDSDKVVGRDDTRRDRTRGLLVRQVRYIQEPRALGAK